MLAVSLVILCATAGLTWLGLMLWVTRAAWRARTEGDAAGPILVLGHRPSPDGSRSAAFEARLARAACLWRKAPQRRVLVLGGRSRPGQPTEASLGRQALIALGVPPEGIATESRSAHTLENLRGARIWLRSAGDTPALVTSRTHLARSALMARGMGIECELCAAEPALTVHACRAVPWEAFLLHWYVTGRLVAWLVRSRRLAARVT